MGLVTTYLLRQIEVQVQRSKLVVWFDPEHSYRDFVSKLQLPETTISSYDGSFFALRHQIEVHLRGEDPPKLLVYVGLAEDATANALIELTAAGTVLAPGQNPTECNTRLSAVTKAALLSQPEKWTFEVADDIARQVDAGQIGSLAEADRVAEKGAESAGVIPLIFGTSNPLEVALQVLVDAKHDREIAAKDAIAPTLELLGSVFGCDLAESRGLVEAREQLAAHVLRTEFVAALQYDLPPGLVKLKVAPVGPARESCLALIGAWRNRFDLRDSYAASAERVEGELSLHRLELNFDSVTTCQTFPALDSILQAWIEASAASLDDRQLSGNALEWLELIERRLGNFWSTWPDRYPEIQARWILIQTALNLLIVANAIDGDLKRFEGSPSQYIDAYARSAPGGNMPWCQLDTEQRHLERRYHDFSFEEKHGSLDRLLARARQRYMEVGGTLAERFVHLLKGAKFNVLEVLPQRNIYSSAVAPAVKEGKTGYLLVDALRFEMARELSDSFQRSFTVDLRTALGTVPSITDIGMAALMPGAERDAQVVALGGGKLGLSIQGTILKDRASRVAWLREHVDVPVAVATVDQVLPKPKKALDQELKDAELILITSQEIDSLCEGDNIHLARKVMDDMLPELAKVIQKLRDYGCARIIVTADHGYLFGDELDTDMKIEAPGGRTDDLHRRVWVGSGGAASASYLRAPLKDFGLSNDLEIAVPWGFGAFISGGGRAYFHGGMAPQELTIPVLTLSPLSPVVNTADTVEWGLQPGSKKISTRFFSVQVTGRITRLFNVDLPRIRIEVRSKSEVLSLPVSASYGFVEATGDVELVLKDEDRQTIDPNTVTLMIASQSSAGSVSVHMLDAANGRELAAPLKIDMDIAL